MRILIVVPDVVSYGGTFRFLERLLEIHAAHAVTTALLVPLGQCTPSLEALAKRHNAAILAAANNNRSTTPPVMTPFFDALFSWKSFQEWRPDLLVVSTGDPGRMTVAFYYPVPVLYVLHTYPEHRFRFLPRLYLRIGAMLGNQVMTVSDASAAAICRTMGISSDKIAVVHNSCRSGKEERVVRLPLVLTVGHVAPYKNPAAWITVAEQVVRQRSDVTFVWLGDGVLLDQMRERVRALGLTERINFPGYIADPSSYYAKAQVYFQPSLRESHGIAVLEAMIHGIPCVVANTGGLPESVTNGATGFVCSPEDCKGFEARIMQLLDDPVLREHQGNSGKLRAENCFTETEQEGKIMALYSRLVRRTGRG